MKGIKLLFITLLVLLFSGCNQNTELDQLKKAYDLMDADSIDEADMIVSIFTDYKKNMEFTALYNLTKTRLLFRQQEVPQNDSLINVSINYYKNVNEDKYLLSESYFYKGACLSDRLQNDEATKNLKEAEILALELNNSESLHKIYEILCLTYYRSGLYNYGKEYARKSLAIAQKKKNYNWFAYACHYMSIYYVNEHKLDSASFYLSKAKRYLTSLNDEAKSIILSSLAEDYMQQGNEEEALELLNQAIDDKPTPYAFAKKSEIYLKRGEKEEALTTLYDALKLASFNDSIYITDILIAHTYNESDFEEACKWYNLRFQLAQQNEERKREHNLIKVQAQYNMLSKEKEFQSTIQKVTFAIIGLIIVFIVVFFINSLRMLRMKKDQIRDQLLIEVYNNKIKDLESSESYSSMQVEDLKNKVTKLQQKQGERLSEGKKLYEHIANGGSIISWDKQDYSNLFDYYTLIDMPFMAHMEKDYDNLSARSMIYLILCNMGKTEEEIEKIFGISNSSVRSLKSRTKSRLIDKNSK